MQTVQAFCDLDLGLDRPAPVPMDAPPVGPARARRLRLLQLREQFVESGDPVDVDAIAGAIARRALFTRELAQRLAGEKQL